MRIAAVLADRSTIASPVYGSRFFPSRAARGGSAAVQGSIWVFLELYQGMASPLVWGLVGEGRRLAEQRGAELSAVLLGPSARALQTVALESFGHGVDTVHMVEAAALAYYSREAFTGALVGLVGRYQPGAVLFAASRIAHDLADSLSAALGVHPVEDLAQLDEHGLGIAAITPDPAVLPDYQPDRTGHIILEPVWGTEWARA
jgi:hypothetical protein